MKWLGCLTLLVAVIVVSGQNETTSNTTDAGDTTVVTDSSTDATNTTVLSTTTSTPSIAPMTTSTPESSSPSEPPTTSPNITTLGPENNTTAADNVTTEIPPTTTPVVSTTVQPEIVEMYYLIDPVNNDTCIMAKMEVSLSLNVTLADGNVTTLRFVLPNDTTVDESAAANCSKELNKQMLELGFKGANTLTFTFSKDGDNVALSGITFVSTNLQTLFANVAPNQTANSTYMGGNQFETPTAFSYMCNADVQLPLTGGNSITLSRVQWEALRGDNKDTTFKAAKECSNDDSDVSDIVPIAVGCALAGLVVIVLIAYLVGRRQNRQRGYESV